MDQNLFTGEIMDEQDSSIIEQLTAENRYLRHQLDRTFEEALRLRHKLEHIYALSHLALHAGTGAAWSLNISGSESLLR